MIRFLQQDNRLTKALFVVIIAAASVSMVVYLIPGLMGQGASGADTFAVVYPHWYSRFLSSGDVISQQKVQSMATRRIQQQYPQYAGNPMIMNMIVPQVGQQLVQQQILLNEAEKLGIRVTDADLRSYLQSGPAGQVLFPNGQFIGSDKYAQMIESRFDMTVPDFEQSVKEDIAIRRLESLITAGVTVSDKDVREAYRKSNIKIKFDYAVVNSEDLSKQINPSDADLEAFFKKNAARYANAVPEERTISYFAFTAEDVPGGVQQPTQQEIQQYYSSHMQEFSAPEQARARHILIKVAQGADAKDGCGGEGQGRGYSEAAQGRRELC